MDPLAKLRRDLFLTDLYRNQPDPDRTVEVTVVGNERISIITRPDGTQFKVVATQPRPGVAEKYGGATAKIYY